MIKMTTVAEWVARTCQEIGVSRVFLYPGGTIAPLVNACIKYGIEIEVFKNEQGAGYAALASARITSKPQVVMVTSGPGVTNVVTPIADAYYDSTPLVVFTGQIGTADLSSRQAVRQRGFQEVPTVALTQPITKRSTCMMSVEDVVREVPLAFQIARMGRQGPVVIDFPMDIQRREFDDIALRKLTAVISVCEPEKLDHKHLNEVATIASVAKRPVVLLGQGALNAQAFSDYAEIANVIDARVVTSFLGTGCFDTSDPRWLGYVGHTGHLAANRAVFESDFLLVLGSRLDVRQTGTVVDKFVPRGKIAWVDIDSSELENPRVQTTWRFQSEVAAFCSAFLKELEMRSSPADAGWADSLADLKQQNHEDRPRQAREYIQPRPLLHALARLVENKPTMVVTGVGCHQHWTARHLPFHPEHCRLLTSGGHGTMGYDLPTAIGAAIAQPERRVLCAVGDGSFLMNIQEMAALSERSLDVKILVFNNRRLGIVSQFQLITWGGDPTTGEFGVPDLVTISRGFGVPAEQLERPADIDEKLEWLWSQQGPALLNVMIDPEADIVPMLLAGQTMVEMWMGRETS
jgi:acetolactate synthase-1/2/3 large subunit